MKSLCDDLDDDDDDVCPLVIFFHLTLLFVLNAFLTVERTELKKFSLSISVWLKILPSDTLI